MIKLKPGINEHISNADYHSENEHLSSSNIKDVISCPEKVREKLWGLTKYESKPYFDDGTVAHQITLEPELGLEGISIYEGATKRGKLWTEFEEKNKGKIVITRSKYEDIIGWRDAVWNDKIAGPLVKGGIAEQTFCGEIEGIKVKVRTDYRIGNMLVDLKTTSKALTYEEISKSIKGKDGYKYHLSLALYRMIANQYLPKDEQIEDVMLVYVNKKEASVQVVKLSEETLYEGEELVIKGIRKFKSLKESGYFDINRKSDIMVI